MNENVPAASQRQKGTSCFVLNVPTTAMLHAETYSPVSLN